MLDSLQKIHSLQLCEIVCWNLVKFQPVAYNISTERRMTFESIDGITLTVTSEWNYCFFCKGRNSNCYSNYYVTHVDIKRQVVTFLLGILNQTSSYLYWFYNNRHIEYLSSYVLTRTWNSVLNLEKKIIRIDILHFILWIHFWEPQWANIGLFVDIPQ